MKPMIEIRSVPISIEYKTTPARVERANTNAEVEITRDKKGLSIKSRPIQVKIDTFEARNSISPSPRQAVEDFGNAGKQAGFTATATYSHEGSVMVNIHMRDNDAITQLAAERFNAPLSYDFNIKYLPDQPINMDWLPGEIQIDYKMDELNFDWITDPGQIQFIPASIEFVIAERPQVIIEYVGDPLYVPPSANPNYEPAFNILA